MQLDSNLLVPAEASVAHLQDSVETARGGYILALGRLEVITVLVKLNTRPTCQVHACLCLSQPDCRGDWASGEFQWEKGATRYGGAGV